MRYEHTVKSNIRLLRKWVSIYIYFLKSSDRNAGAINKFK